MPTKAKRILSTPRFDILQFNYRKSKYYSVDKTNAVVILPILDGNKVVLERQYRPVVGKYIFELPAGRLEEGESYATAAVRELKEETGYTASKVSLMFKAFTSPGFTTEFVHFYLAEGLSKGRRKLDRNERISVRIVELKKVLQMIKDNRIEDAETIAPILYYATLLRE